MFHLQGIVFIALLCAVNAAIIINVYDNGPETNKLNLHKCDYYQCMAYCQSKGYVGGFCKDPPGICQCLGSQGTKHKLRECNDHTCDQLCRRMGFISGSCVGTHCKCDNFLTHTDVPKNNDNIVVETVGACNDQGCDFVCRGLGYKRGSCVQGDCVCSNSQNHGLVLEIGTNKLKSCNDQECDQRCRQMGFISGKCNGGRCSCRIKSKNENILEELALEIGTKELESCNDQECDQRCRQMGFISGKCNEGRCSCRIKSNNENILEELALEIGAKELESCNDQECDQRCRQMGFISGRCNGGRCSCRIKLNNEDIREDTSEDFDNDIMRGVESCNDQGCNTVCRALGYKSGSCIQGDCVCSNGLDDEKTVVKSMNDLMSCNNQDCDRRCRQLGYISGKCVGDRCLCRIRQDVDATALSDNKEISLNDEDNEISNNEILSNAIVECSKNACENTCQGLGHTGGKCFLGRCQCSVQVKAEATKSVKDCNQVNCTFTCIRMHYIGGNCQDGRCFCV